MIPLSADLVARAVIAAAVHYGDDPERALTVERGILKRCLKPAALGLHAALGGDANRYARVLGLDLKNVYKDRTPTVLRAAQAVADAVSYAMGPKWKPQMVAPLEETHRGESYADAIAAVLKGLFEEFPDGVTSEQMAAAMGLSKLQVCAGARILHERHVARWVRLPYRNMKLLKPWTAPLAPEAPAPFPVRDERPKAAPKAEPTPSPVPIGPRSPRNPLAPVIHPRATAPDAPLGDRICGMLRGTDASPQGLATLLDAKEILVSQCLAALEQQGVVAADPVPPEGRRFQRWRLRAEEMAA